MISIDVNLDPLGVVEARRSLATVAIWNDGTGDSAVGNYRFAISHQFDSAYAPGGDLPTTHDLVDGGPWVWKEGRVERFQRRRGAMALLAAVLRAARL